MKQFCIQYEEPLVYGLHGRSLILVIMLAAICSVIIWQALYSECRKYHKLIGPGQRREIHADWAIYCTKMSQA